MRKMTSPLVDNICRSYNKQPIKQFGDEWYLAKPMTIFSQRWRWCIEILRGHAIAVHFKEDEPPAGAQELGVKA